GGHCAEPASPALGLQPLAAACAGVVAAAACRGAATGYRRTGVPAAVDSWLRGRPAPAAAAAQQYPAGRPERVDQGLPGRAGDFCAQPGSWADRPDRLQPALWRAAERCGEPGLSLSETGRCAAS